VGEILARAEQYLFLVGMMQHFKIKAHGPVPSREDYLSGINFHVKPFKIEAEPRF